MIEGQSDPTKHTKQKNHKNSLRPNITWVRADMDGNSDVTGWSTEFTGRDAGAEVLRVMLETCRSCGVRLKCNLILTSQPLYWTCLTDPSLHTFHKVWISDFMMLKHDWKRMEGTVHMPTRWLSTRFFFFFFLQRCIEIVTMSQLATRNAELRTEKLFDGAHVLMSPLCSSSPGWSPKTSLRGRKMMFSILNRK